MGTNQRFLTIALWGLMVLGMLGLVGTGLWVSRRSQATPPSAMAIPDHQQQGLPVLFDLPKFTLVDQNNKPFTDDQLRGHAWVGCFVFTHCAGPCPLMFMKMAEMQKDLGASGVKQICFTVDPERDTPEVLKAKAASLGADESNWSFLTSDRPTIEKLKREMFQAKPGESDSPLMHDSKFYLFDATGHCRGRYSSNDEADLAKLKTDAATLAAEARGAGGKSS